MQNNPLPKLFKQFNIGQTQSVIDTHGILMAAIQGLNTLLLQQAQLIEVQNNQLQQLASQVQSLEKQIEHWQVTAESK